MRGIDPLSQKSRFDLMPKYKFEIDFTPLSWAYSSINISATNAKGGAFDTERIPDLIIASTFQAFKLTGLVKSVELPEVQISAEAKNIGSTKISVLNSNDVDPLVIDFYSDTDSTAKQMYYNWCKLMFETSTNTQLPRNLYERDLKIIIHDRNDAVKEIRNYFGCSPRTITKQRYDYADAGMQEPVSITFDVNNGMNITFVPSVTTFTTI